MIAAQLRILHALYSAYASHSLDTVGDNPRDARLAWASATIGRELRSFKELKDSEADALIDALKTLTAQEVKSGEHWKRPRDRHLAKALGTHGRRGRRSNDEVIASAGDLAAIEEMWQRLGWTRSQFDAWLTSPTSPLAANATTELRTWRQANRVRWALKALLKRNGLWRKCGAA